MNYRPLSCNSVIWLLVLLFSIAGVKGTSCLAADSTGMESTPGWNIASQDSDEQVAKDFLDMLVLDPQAMRLNGLFSRKLLSRASQLYQQKKYLEAAAAYQEYFFAKLRDPQAFGLSPLDANPFTRGVAGGIQGMGHTWPAAPLNPDEPADQLLDKANKLLQGVATIKIKNQPTDQPIGKAGQVNWYLPVTAVSINQIQGIVPDAGLTNATLFNALAYAYMRTSNVEYLRSWSLYMDDWARNANYVNSVKPLFVSDQNTGAGVGGVINFIKVLGGVARMLPPDQVTQVIPPATFVRVLGKYLTQFPLMSMMYTRSNTHNWTPSSQLFSMSLWFDEFKFGDVYFREGRRRNIEDPAVTQNLPDGSASELDPWYNENFINTANAIGVMNRRQSLPAWQETSWGKKVRNNLQWRLERQHELDMRVQYFIHLRTPQNQWPLGLNGGDKRTASGLDFANIALQTYGQPGNRGIYEVFKGGSSQPGFTSEWFPYAGYNIVRDGWKKNDGYGFMFCTPQPAAYGAFRGRSNNNFFGLNAYGQDLLVDDTMGHYMYPSTPLTVDDAQQFFNAGLYKVPQPQAHKVYQINAWSEPADWRWFASDQFNLMEGVYNGPWLGKKRNSKTIQGKYGPDQSGESSAQDSDVFRDVEHQRLVLYVRDAHLWIVTDRLNAKDSHKYNQVWRIPSVPAPNNVPAFTPEQIKINADQKTISTEGDLYNNIPMANLSLYQFSKTPLTYNSKLVKRPEQYGRQLMYSATAINVSWQGQGDQQLITVIHPRKPSSQSDEQDTDRVKQIKQLTSGQQGLGFEATMPDGKVVQYLASPLANDTLTLGSITLQGKALLIQGNQGIALNASALSIQGQAVKLSQTDFAFTVTANKLTAITPIYRPIKRVIISPDRNVFTESQKITLTCPTPDVEIRYTLDGTEPTPQSTLYGGPFQLTQSTVVHARAYRPGTKENPLQLSGTQATVRWHAVYQKERPLPSLKNKKTQPGLTQSYYQADWKQMFLMLDALKPQSQTVTKNVLDMSTIPSSNPPVDPSLPGPRENAYALVDNGYIDVPADGVYTFHAPHEYIWPATEAGYELRVYVGQHVVPWGNRTTVAGLNEWYPATRRHAFGNWSIALAKGVHPIKIIYIDYRMDAAHFYNKPGLKDFIWTGLSPKLLVSGPDMQPQPIPSQWLRH